MTFHVGQRFRHEKYPPRIITGLGEYYVYYTVANGEEWRISSKELERMLHAGIWIVDYPPTLRLPVGV